MESSAASWLRMKFDDCEVVDDLAHPSGRQACPPAAVTSAVRARMAGLPVVDPCEPARTGSGGAERMPAPKATS